MEIVLKLLPIALAVFVSSLLLLIFKKYFSNAGSRLTEKSQLSFWIRYVMIFIVLIFFLPVIMGGTFLLPAGYLEESASLLDMIGILIFSITAVVGSFLLGNLTLWLIPVTRKTLNANLRASFAETNKGLMKAFLALLVLCLIFLLVRNLY